MASALIDHNAATRCEYAPVHKDTTNRAFEVLDFFIRPVAIPVDSVQMLPVDGENVRDCAFKQNIDFPRIEEQAETVFAAFDQKCTVKVEINSL